MMIIDDVPFYKRETESISPLIGTWLTEYHLAYDDGRLIVWDSRGFEVPVHLLNDVETEKMLKRLPEFLKYVRKHIENLEKRVK
jgi:hypothetical protein